MIHQSLHRPVAVTMAYASVALLGAAAWRNVPLEMLPDEQLPSLTIRAAWPGASPETVEAFLAAPLEASVQQVRGVENVASTSMENLAVLEVEFSRLADMDFARLDLSERIAALEESLPPGIGEISVEPYVPEEFAEQTRPFLEYTFTGPYTLEALGLHLDEVVVPEILRVDGVAFVRVAGGRRRLLEIRLDEQRITSLGLTPTEVRDAVRNLDLVREAGSVREGERRRSVTIVNRPGSAEDVRRAVVTAIRGQPVRVADVAEIHDTYQEPTSLSRIDGQPAVSFSVAREIGTNTIRVADAVEARMADLERLNPYGSAFVLEFDQSREIREQLGDLRTRAAFAALVVFGVLLAFLRSLRSAGLVFATIVFSVCSALALVYFGGLTLNLLTMMGLAIGFGLVVDNSIVVIENIYRRRQGGDPPVEAAERGTREVVPALLASTATTLIVFVSGPEPPGQSLPTGDHRVHRRASWLHRPGGAEQLLRKPTGTRADLVRHARRSPVGLHGDCRALRVAPAAPRRHAHGAHGADRRLSDLLLHRGRVHARGIRGGRHDARHRSEQRDPPRRSPEPHANRGFLSAAP